MTSLLLDTSIMVAAERGDMDRLPPSDGWFLSAMTIAELNIGLLLAPSIRSRQRFLDTMTHVSTIEVLPFDEPAARTYAELMVWSESAGVRPNIPDGMIAATASTNGLTLVTLDSDFSRLAEFEGLDVVVL